MTEQFERDAHLPRALQFALGLWCADPAAVPPDITAALLWRVLRGRHSSRWPVQLATLARCRWRTIGAKVGDDGKRHGGIPVCIGDDGMIRKGPPHLTGRHVARLREPSPLPAPTSRQREVAEARQYELAGRRREARREGLDPREVESVANELRRAEREHLADRIYVYRTAKARLPLGPLRRAFRSGDAHTLERARVAIDDLASEISGAFPHVISPDTATEDLFDLLRPGRPQLRSDAELWGEALKIARESRAREWRPRRAWTLEEVPFSLTRT
jgi:hypothetical protein